VNGMGDKAILISMIVGRSVVWLLPDGEEFQEPRSKLVGQGENVSRPYEKG